MVFLQSLRRHNPDQVRGSRASRSPLSLGVQAPRANISCGDSIEGDGMNVKLEECAKKTKPALLSSKLC